MRFGRGWEEGVNSELDMCYRRWGCHSGKSGGHKSGIIIQNIPINPERSLERHTYRQTSISKMYPKKIAHPCMPI